MTDDGRGARGSGARRVDPKPALDHLDELQRAGLTLRQIATAGGLGRATVSALVRQYRQAGAGGVAMSEATSAALLAIDVMASAGTAR
ncbi:hypothetical protein KXS11_17635 [Plantibacter flavus]|uniref:hypothetical protein n=1 Tax=Plantibacter flavus TaxID=150123 RepID=UPI003F15B9A2